VVHLAVLRRFLQVGERALLLGAQSAALHALDLPFGFLTCGSQVAAATPRPVGCGVANPVRVIRADRRVQIYGGCAMVLPLRAGMDSWPASGRVDRNGYEV
jgi:Nodulation protein A (NodA)